jgi:hypothetical protein
MNTIEFKLTGGIDASRTAMHEGMLKFCIPYELREYIIFLGRNARKNPGGESLAQAMLDALNYYGLWGIKNMIKSGLADKEVKRWKGIKAAKAKKRLHKFVNDR